MRELWLTEAPGLHVETIWMSPGSFTVRVQLKQDRGGGRSVTTLIGAVDAEQRSRALTELSRSSSVPRRSLRPLEQLDVPLVRATCLAHWHGAHGGGVWGGGGRSLCEVDL